MTPRENRSVVWCAGATGAVLAVGVVLRAGQQPWWDTEVRHDLAAHRGGVAARLLAALEPSHVVLVTVALAVAVSLVQRRIAPAVCAAATVAALAVVVLGLQHGIHRTGPRGASRNGSYPSGYEATLVGCLCYASAVLGLFRRWWALAVGAGLAVLLGWVLLYLRDHWLSDVLAGAACGIVVAYVAARLTGASPVHPSPSGDLSGRVP